MISAQPSVLVIGLGNPLLGDDGVGWAVIEELRNRLQATPDNPADRELFSSVELDSLSLGGLSLMERLVDYSRVILIDAMVTGNQPIGSVQVFDLEQLSDQHAGHTASAHDVSLKTALRVGRSMGFSLPEQIWVIAVESRITYEFSDALSPPVQAAVPKAAELAIRLIREWIHSPPPENKSKITKQI